ncbi:uncharacterized protein LOC126964730 [Leptidea sinapis]|uniref:uncharacterized protein LOC126964730 n=1 Tax=Leptidea sinapis TaxID=189913 RepID=UPI0021C45785|nr:uncharacterized protein LOC126964730 [Leptidea sinapis]
MTPSTAGLVFAVLLTGATIIVAQNNGRVHGLDLLRLLAEKPWEPHKWDPRSEDLTYDVQGNNLPRDFDDDQLRSGSEKRSAVATVLNGRRRRQPAPALGKAVTPYVGVGVLNDVGSFFDTLRDNLETLASLSPEQRSSLFQQPPTVVQAQAAGGGGGGMRRIHALRPLRPTGNIRRSAATQQQTIMTLGCCGLVWAGRRFTRILLKLFEPSAICYESSVIYQSLTLQNYHLCIVF